MHKKSIMTYIVILTSIFIGCSNELTETELVGKWVVRDGNTSTTARPYTDTIVLIGEPHFSFREDKSFTFFKLPYFLCAPSDTAQYISGSGKWEIKDGPSGQSGVWLYFKIVNGEKSGYINHVQTSHWFGNLDFHFTIGDPDSMIRLYFVKSTVE